MNPVTLTLTLLTWTKWRAPTNASKWQMGFNSAFKGLITFNNLISRFTNSRDTINVLFLSLIWNMFSFFKQNFIPIAFVDIFCTPATLSAYLMFLDFMFWRSLMRTTHLKLLTDIFSCIHSIFLSQVHALPSVHPSFTHGQAVSSCLDTRDQISRSYRQIHKEYLILSSFFQHQTVRWRTANLMGP